MWRLSDRTMEEFRNFMKETVLAVKECATKLAGKVEWKELPKPEKCVLYGVDGSMGSEKRSRVIVYAVSGVAIGKDVLEIHDIAAMKTYKQYR
ncbi:MAG: hypothetical protein ACTSSJ_04020 [Candidatus Odinarchaeia archaeon]